jgi:hypothetical protein
MIKQIASVLLLALIFIIPGCSSDSSAPEIEEHPFEPLAPVNPQPKQERLFGITVSESTDGYLADFAVAQQAGIQTAELSLQWDAVETADGVYQDPNGILAAMAFYEANDISLMLTFAVINTVVRTTPDHLDAYDWNAPELMASFNNMVDWVFSQLPAGLDVVGVSIGNEVNFVLGNDEWTPYGEFFQAGSTHLHTIDPALNVGIKMTVRDGLFGLMGNNIKQLNQHTDVVMLNYYLMDSEFQVVAPIQVYSDFNTIIGNFPGREIWMTEVGYQSGSEFCSSSEDQQAGFYHELFSAWDSHRHEMQYLMVDWLHDASAQQLAEWEQYYGVSDPAFLEYLGTLGLRTHDGEDKNAWIQLLAETNARGWVND